MNDERCWNKKSKLNHVILERQKNFTSLAIIYIYLSISKTVKNRFLTGIKKYPTQQPCKSLLLSPLSTAISLKNYHLINFEKNTNRSRLCGPIYLGSLCWWIKWWRIEKSTTILLLMYDAENMTGAEVIVIGSHFEKEILENKVISVSLDSAFKNRTIIKFERYSFNGFFYKIGPFFFQKTGDFGISLGYLVIFIQCLKHIIRENLRNHNMSILK